MARQKSEMVVVFWIRYSYVNCTSYDCVAFGRFNMTTRKPNPTKKKLNRKEQVNELCKAIEMLTLEIRYMPIPKRKFERDKMKKDFTELSKGLGEVIKDAES